MIGEKNYRFGLKSKDDGSYMFSYTKVEPIGYTLVKGALLLGLLAYAYIKLSVFF